MLVNTFVMCHGSDTTIEEVDKRTSNYSSSLDLSGKKYYNCVNAFIPLNSECPYVSKFMTIERDDEGRIEKLELNSQFTATVKTMLGQGGNLYFIDTIGGADKLVEEMEKLGFYYYGLVFLTVNSRKLEFMQYVML